jgi:large conductance mechanosensitive channel
VLLKPGTVPGPYLTVDAAQKAGAVMLNYGAFINNIISFVIVAFTVFLLVKAVNRMRREEAKAPAVPAAPPEDVLLLREIRDSLRRP